jgi:hypothetical protein
VLILHAAWCSLRRVDMSVTEKMEVLGWIEHNMSGAGRTIKALVHEISNNMAY